MIVQNSAGLISAAPSGVQYAAPASTVRQAQAAAVARWRNTTPLPAPLLLYGREAIFPVSAMLRIYAYSLLPALSTRCSAIAERPRCRVRYSFGQKWKIGTGRQYFTDIIGLSSTTVISSAWKCIEFGEKRKIRAITVFKVIQGHRGWYQSKDRMQFPISD